MALLFLIGLSASTPDAQVVPASEVVAKIKAGQPANFDNYTIEGYLNLSTLVIDEVVHFNNTIFQDSVNCNFTTFGKVAYFISSTFKADAYFRSSNFNDEIAYFRSSNFNGTAYFRSSNFEGYAYLGDSNFKGYANFEFSNFKGYANFGFSNFKGYADFRYSKFNSTADFWDSNFKGYADFKYSNFNGDNYFGYSNFKGDADFGYSNFKGDVEFYSSRFNGTAFFLDSKFNGSAFFVESVFNKKANFYEAKFNGSGDFIESQFVGEALFENASFKKTLYLTRTRYDKLYIRWYNISRLDFDDAAYMSLLKNFKDLGYFEDYDSCYYQYRKEHREQPWPLVKGIDLPLRKVIDVFLDWFYGYGTKPLNALYFSIATIIAFGLYWNWIGLGKREWPPIARSEGHLLWNAMIFSLTVFLSGTKLFIDPPDVPILQGRSQSFIRKAFTAERAFGALFSILFFLAIESTIVR